MFKNASFNNHFAKNTSIWKRTVHSENLKIIEKENLAKKNPYLTLKNFMQIMNIIRFSKKCGILWCFCFILHLKLKKSHDTHIVNNNNFEYFEIQNFVKMYAH